jgi:hypothetical protein
MRADSPRLWLPRSFQPETLCIFTPSLLAQILRLYPIRPLWLGGPALKLNLRLNLRLACGLGCHYFSAMNARDEVLEFLVGHIPSQAWSDFHPSEAARQRIWALIEKEKGFGLLPEEKVELDDYLKLEHLLVLAKAKARLAGQHG